MNDAWSTDPIDAQDWCSRRRLGTVEIPVHYMRGGTSTGVVLWEPLLPADPQLREQLLRHLMGVPATGSHPGNRQITGLGRGPATSNKVFVMNVERSNERLHLVSTLAQLASEHADVDWSVNCGNMSSALLLWALDLGLIDTAHNGLCEVDIRNTNTGVVTSARMQRDAQGQFVDAVIPGVMGDYPAVDLFLHSPVGNKTGALLPTGSVVDRVAGIEVSCVDVAVPMVIVDARSLGKTGHEPITALEADRPFMATLREVWTQAGLKMGLRRKDGQLMNALELQRSETVPKICLVAAPREGGHIAVRYFTPQTAHASMAVSGGCCLAAACLIPGTTAQRIASGIATVGEAFADIQVSIENPAGRLDTTVVAALNDRQLQIRSAAYRRNTQILMRGHVPLYGASNELQLALLAPIASSR
jgi:4-oxalomesaconate tautomerase